MKKILSIVIVALFLTTSCNKNDEIDDTGLNQIILTSQNDNVTLEIAGAGTVNIDWGDKTQTETFLVNEGEQGVQSFNHAYSNSSIRSIILTGNNLTYLYCPSQGIIKIDVSRNPELSGLNCGFNKLEKLDVSRNTALRVLSCYGNKLKDLDISKNVNLVGIICTSNQLTKLDVGNNTQLYALYCDNNNLSTESLNELFGTLNNNTFIQTKLISLGYNPGTNTCDLSIAESKGWNVFINTN